MDRLEMTKHNIGVDVGQWGSVTILWVKSMIAISMPFGLDHSIWKSKSLI